MVVGTRGQRGMMQAWAGAFVSPGVGSVSKYVTPLLPRPFSITLFIREGFPRE